jgi:hypothetical protein
MEMPRLPKSVRRVVTIQRDEKGTLVPITVYKSSSKKKKVSSALKPFEKMMRRMAKSQQRVADTYLSKHDKSTRKRKDGWLKDLVANVTTAGNKGRKTLTKGGMSWPRVVRVN